MATNIKQNVGTWKEKLNLKLKEKNFFTNILEKIETKTGVSRLYITLGLVALLVLYLMVGYGAQFLCNFVGFLYPAYASVKAIESPSKVDDTQWLMYWTVYGFFSLLEFFTDIFLFWIPFYPLLKCIFLTWCMCSASWNGSDTIYNRLIKPFILRHQSKIDETIDRATGCFKEVKNVVVEEAGDVANEAVKKRLLDSSKFE